MSKAQHPDFNLQFIKDNINQWSLAANNYHREAEKAYTRMRSYLTLYQFRLSEQEKCDIREMVSQHLDEIDQHDLVTDMDNYLDGFCFKIDKSVLPLLTPEKPKPTAVKIEIAPPNIQPMPAIQNRQFMQPPIAKPTIQPIPEQIIEPMQPALPEPTQEMLDSFIPITHVSDNAVDYSDLDFYTRQFYQ